jgi:hypothetical protein
MIYILRFRSLLLLILLGVFLAYSSLGAGSNERTRTPLVAHQKRISFANKGEHGCCDLQPNYVSCIGNSTSIRSLYINASFHHLCRFTPINHQLITSLQETRRI